MLDGRVFLQEGTTHQLSSAPLFLELAWCQLSAQEWMLQQYNRLTWPLAIIWGEDLSTFVVTAWRWHRIDLWPLPYIRALSIDWHEPVRQFKKTCMNQYSIRKSILDYMFMLCIYCLNLKQVTGNFSKVYVALGVSQGQCLDDLTLSRVPWKIRTCSIYAKVRQAKLMVWHKMETGPRVYTTFSWLYPKRYPCQIRATTVQERC